MTLYSTKAMMSKSHACLTELSGCTTHFDLPVDLIWCTRSASMMLVRCEDSRSCASAGAKPTEGLLLPASLSSTCDARRTAAITADVGPLEPSSEPDIEARADVATAPAIPPPTSGPGGEMLPKAAMLAAAMASSGVTSTGAMPDARLLTLARRLMILAVRSTSVSSVWLRRRSSASGRRLGFADTSSSWLRSTLCSVCGSRCSSCAARVTMSCAGSSTGWTLARRLKRPSSDARRLVVVLDVTLPLRRPDLTEPRRWPPADADSPDDERCISLGLPSTDLQMRGARCQLERWYTN